MQSQLDNLTIKQAAELLQVSEETIRRHVRQGHYPAFKVGRQWRIRKKEFLAIFELTEKKAAEEASK